MWEICAPTVDEFWQYYVKWSKSVTLKKNHMTPLIWINEVLKLIEIGNRILVSMDWTEREMVKERLVNRYRVSVVQDEKVLEICYITTWT